VRAPLPTRRRPLRLAAGALVVGLLAYGLLSHAATAHRQAPALPALRLSGPPATLAALRGHAAVIVFWASWCPGCHDEAPAVAQFARSAAGRGHVIAVDSSDGGSWRAFLAGYHWQFPVFADRDGRTTLAYGVQGLPGAVFLDPHGRIVKIDLAALSAKRLADGLAAAA
jgi:thiol-disulfide isomerase/thioredoxin